MINKLMILLLILIFASTCYAGYRTDTITITGLPSKSALATDSNGTIIEGTGGAGSSYNFTQSLSESSGNVSLVNDSPSPGNSTYYGTNSSGTKGFFTIPSSGANTELSNLGTTAINTNLMFDNSDNRIITINNINSQTSGKNLSIYAGNGNTNGDGGILSFGGGNPGFYSGSWGWVEVYTQFRLKNNSNKYAIFDTSLLTSNNIYQFPNKSGTFALLDDLHNAVTLNANLSNILVLSTQELSAGASTANYFLAAPSGGNGTVAMRAIVDADIPNNITIDTAGTATTASFATSSGSATTATYASSSGTATTANYATSSGSATTATYASSSGTATTATYAGTGPFAPSYSSITASYALISPSGSAGTPTFRALVALDIPDLSATYLPLHSKADTAGNADTVTNGVYTTSPVTALAAATGADKDKYVHSNASTGALEFSTVAGGSMTWPAGAGIAVYSGSSSWGTSLTAPTGTILGTTDTQTLTNKRITKRVVTDSDATSITPNSDNADIEYQLNTQAAGTLTIGVDTGTPTNGQSLIFKIKSTNVQTLSFTTGAKGFYGGTLPLPTATSGGGLIDYYAFIHDTVSGKWHYTGQSVGNPSS